MNVQNPCAPNAAARRYLIRLFPAMAVYVATLFASIWAIRHFEPHGPWLWALALAPAMPLLAAIAVLGLYVIEETDEFLRTLLVQAMLWGIGLTLAACTVWGSLERAGVVGHLQPMMLFPMFCFAMGLSHLVVRWRYT